MTGLDPDTHVAQNVSFILSGLFYSLALRTVNGAQIIVNHQIYSLTFSIQSQSRQKSVIFFCCCKIVTRNMNWNYIKLYDSFCKFKIKEKLQILCIIVGRLKTLWIPKLLIVLTSILKLFILLKVKFKADDFSKRIYCLMRYLIIPVIRR